MAKFVDLSYRWWLWNNVGSTIIDLSGTEPEIIREGKEIL
jgi:tRNA A37 threonylcarbamoyladenosine synthetase subunit TsaC/SUA5/YrdC